MKHPVILDVDTGIDDAMAIMFAVRHPDVDLRAITCVSGNVSLDRVVANTLKVLDVVGAPEIPVAGGAVTPLVEVRRDASQAHGASGLGTLDLPESARAVSPLHAVELLRREILGSEQPVTLVELAPMTNLALLLRMHPEAASNIARIVFMGGAATVGNATAVAEFNVWHDPEAAHIVVSSGLPLLMYGLEPFEAVIVSDDRLSGLEASADPVANALAGLLGFQMGDPEDGEAFARIGDAGAVVALVTPELFDVETWPLRVELAPGFSRGQTIVDRRRFAGEDAHHDPNRIPWPTGDVVLGADVDGVVDAFLATVL